MCILRRFSIGLIVRTGARVAQQPSEHLNLARHLWTCNQDLATGCLQHPFVCRLADGSLPAAAFRAYVAQDAYFIEAFARAYAFALARCPDRYGFEAFQKLIAGVVDELELHATYARRLGIDLGRVVRVARRPAGAAARSLRTGWPDRPLVLPSRHAARAGLFLVSPPQPAVSLTRDCHASPPHARPFQPRSH